MTDIPTKPPLGVMPQWRWRELRVHDLVAAISRFTEAGRLGDPLVAGWCSELQNHIAAAPEDRQQEGLP